jgi:hypothetical protein
MYTILTYFYHSYRPILPDIIDKLWSRCGGEEEPMLFETDRAQAASSLTKPTPIAEKIARSSKKTPMDANARVKLLESRIRGPSSETLVTDAAWATKGESKQAQKSNSSSVNLLSSNRKLPSTTINLPFMKREIEMTKSLSSSSKSKSYSTALTQQKPSGSRRKITTPKSKYCTSLLVCIKFHITDISIARDTNSCYGRKEYRNCSFTQTSGIIPNNATNEGRARFWAQIS